MGLQNGQAFLGQIAIAIKFIRASPEIYTLH